VSPAQNCQADKFDRPSADAAEAQNCQADEFHPDAERREIDRLLDGISRRQMGSLLGAMTPDTNLRAGKKDALDTVMATLGATSPRFSGPGMREMLKRLRAPDLHFLNAVLIDAYRNGERAGIGRGVTQ